MLISFKETNENQMISRFSNNWIMKYTQYIWWNDSIIRSALRSDYATKRREMNLNEKTNVCDGHLLMTWIFNVMFDNN